MCTIINRFIWPVQCITNALSMLFLAMHLSHVLQLSGLGKCCIYMFDDITQFQYGRFPLELKEKNDISQITKQLDSTRFSKSPNICK